MLLSQLTVDPASFQNRSHPYSNRTVKGILAEGLKPSKFDAIPILHTGGKKFVIAGDGHSRYEAVRRMANLGKLPRDWKRGGDWDIPTRTIPRADAQRISWTANLNRDGFTPCEQARVFQKMLDAGLTLAQVSAEAHESEVYVTRALALNLLCKDIQAAVGAAPAAGGIDFLTGVVLANGFKRWGIEAGQQQQLWHCFLKCAMLNFQSAKRFVDRIGSRLAEKSTDGVLFSLPANAAAVIAQAKAQGAAARTAKTGLGLLLSALKAGAMDDEDPELVELAGLLERSGLSLIEKLAERIGLDGDALADLAAPLKVFKPLPASPADSKMAAQYDPEATMAMF